MSREALAEGAPCPVCALNGVLHRETTSEADLIDGRTVVVHGVPTYVCDRCGVELFDEETTRLLEAFYEHAASDQATTFVVEFATLESRAAS
jgi:YgiT-type zinc finger domain-containing protein